MIPLIQDVAHLNVEDEGILRATAVVERVVLTLFQIVMIARVHVVIVEEVGETKTI